MSPPGHGSKATMRERWASHIHLAVGRYDLFKVKINDNDEKLKAEELFQKNAKLFYNPSTYPSIGYSLQPYSDHFFYTKTLHPKSENMRKNYLCIISVFINSKQIVACIH